MQLNKIFMDWGLAGSAAELATLLVIILAISAAFWFLIGRFKLQNFLINIYISFALVQIVPADFTPFAKNTAIIIFIILLILLTLLSRYLFDIHQYGGGMAIWQAMVVSFLEVVLLFSIIFSFLPAKDVLQYISKDSLVYFVDPWWKVGWMLAPLAFLVFVKKRG